MKDSVVEYVLSVLIDEFHLPIDSAKFTNDTELGPRGLNLESLTFVDLVFRLEDRYRISIREDDYAKISSFTVGELAAYIERAAAAAPASEAEAV